MVPAERVGPHPLGTRDPWHTDSVAVNSFAHVMADKMARNRDKGREGWETCPVPVLWQMLREHVEKGDPVDVACLAMMIHQNSQRDRTGRNGG